jgi:TPR repeat protein
MLQTKYKSPSLYNPATQSDEEIISNFVIRLKEFNELLSAVKTDKMGTPPQHYLIQGQRGYGKTMLLLRLNLAIKTDKELNTWLIPVMFDEEQYSISTLAKLWEEVIHILEDQDESFAGLSDKIDSLYDTESPEEEIYKLLINTLKERNKKLVLLHDNFGDIIKKFSRKENQRLREVLITSNNFRIIGASSAMLEFYYDYKEPLFDFFKVITLEGLDRKDTIILLKKLSETYKADEINKVIESQPERIEALRRLTGGVPRTIVLLFGIFIDDVEGSSFKDLEAILDNVTPLYKHRLDNLSTQQQTIIDAIAQNWDAISTKDIAKKVRMPSKAVSSQLNQLEKNQLIKKIPTSTKNFLYQIDERFFNVYYLMRVGKRKSRNKVLFLVRFFEIWCGEKELIERAQRHIKALHEERLYDKHAFYLTQALSRTGIPVELQHELVSATRDYLSAQKSEFVKELDKSHLEVLQGVVKDVTDKNYDSARKKLINDGANPQEINYTIGNILRIENKDFQSAVEFYLNAANKGHIGAMYNLAQLYQNEHKDIKSAERYYKMAVEKGNTDAMNNLAVLYQTEYKDIKSAERYYKMAIEKGDTDAMNNLAVLYRTERKDSKSAERYYKMAIEKGHTDAMHNLAGLYYKLKKNKTEALSLQKQAYISERKYNRALSYIVILLWNNEIEEAVAVYQKNFDNEEIQKEVNEYVPFILLMFTAKKQYHFVYNLFSENKFEIKDKYKPIYYALLFLMGEEYSDEFKKMGSELKETVDEIIETIKQMSIDYV